MQDSAAVISAGMNGELSENVHDTKPCFSKHSESRLEATSAQSSLHNVTLAAAEPARVSEVADEDGLPPPSRSSTEQTSALAGVIVQETTHTNSETAMSDGTHTGQSPTSAHAAEPSEDCSKAPDDAHLSDREPLTKPLLSADLTVSFLRVSISTLTFSLSACAFQVGRDLHEEHSQHQRGMFVHGTSYIVHCDAP